MKGRSEKGKVKSEKGKGSGSSSSSNSSSNSKLSESPKGFTPTPSRRAQGAGRGSAGILPVQKSAISNPKSEISSPRLRVSAGSPSSTPKKPSQNPKSGIQDQEFSGHPLQTRCKTRQSLAEISRGSSPQNGGVGARIGLKRKVPIPDSGFLNPDSFQDSKIQVNESGIQNQESGIIGASTLLAQKRMRYNPLRGISSESLVRDMEGFLAGNLRPCALIWSAMLQRDATLRKVSRQRISDVARRDWEVTLYEQSPEAEQQRDLLLSFWRSVRWVDAFDRNSVGSLRSLVSAMLQAHSMGYSAHHLRWKAASSSYSNSNSDSDSKTALNESRTSPSRSPSPSLMLEAEHVPLWFFENTAGTLRHTLPSGLGLQGVALDPAEWHVASGEALMHSAGILYVLKHLGLSDWSLFVEKFGLPTKVGTAPQGCDPQSAQWQSLVTALAAMERDGAALFSQGTTVTTLPIPSASTLPHPALVDWADRQIASLYRGSDLSTMSQKGESSGASVQERETLLMCADDCAWVTEQLQRLERTVLEYHGHDPEQPLAGILWRAPITRDMKFDLEIDKQLTAWEILQAKKTICERYERELPDADTPAEELVSAGRREQGAGRGEQGVGVKPLGDSGTAVNAARHNPQSQGADGRFTSGGPTDSGQQRPLTPQQQAQQQAQAAQLLSRARGLLAAHQAQGPQTVIPHPNGKWGSIDQALSDRTFLKSKGKHRLPLGDIQLLVGEYNAQTKWGYGLAKILGKHGQEFADAGVDPITLLDQAFKNPADILYDPDEDSYTFLCNRPTGAIALELRQKLGHYSIVTAYPQSPNTPLQHRARGTQGQRYSIYNSEELAWSHSVSDTSTLLANVAPATAQSPSGEPVLKTPLEPLWGQATNSLTQLKGFVQQDLAAVLQALRKVLEESEKGQVKSEKGDGSGEQGAGSGEQGESPQASSPKPQAPSLLQQLEQLTSGPAYASLIDSILEGDSLADALYDSLGKDFLTALGVEDVDALISEALMTEDLKSASSL